MNRTQLRRLVSGRGLAHLQHELDDVAAPAIGVRSATADPSFVGSSRIGGFPDLPREYRWPTIDSVSLDFVAQIRLEDLSHIEGSELLPARGVLSFFFDKNRTGDGTGHPKYRSRVLWYRDSSELSPRQTPADCTPPAAPRPVEFSGTCTLPSFEEVNAEEHPAIPSLRSIIQTMEDRSRYVELRSSLLTYETRLLGHPDELQGGELRFDVVRHRDEGRRYRYEDYSWTNVEAARAEMRELLLLMQTPINGSMLYFFIKKGDLSSRHFDRAFAYMQGS